MEDCAGGGCVVVPGGVGEGGVDVGGEEEEGGGIGRFEGECESVIEDSNVGREDGCRLRGRGGESGL